MKAAYLERIGKLSVGVRPDPALGLDDALVEPVVVGVCGTDNHIVDGHYPSRPPVILGHEIAARVVEVRAERSPVGVGDLVTVDPHRYCGACEYCRRAMEHMCVAKEAYGVHLDGGMAELLVVPAKRLYAVGPEVTPSVAALAEPLACCVHGIDRLAPSSGLPIIVFGCGAAGAMLIALCRHAGLRPIVAVEPNPRKRELAMRMGADITIDPGAEDVAEQAMRAVGGDGYPYLIDAVGSTDVLITAMQLAGRGGKILVFGVAAPAAVAPIQPNLIYSKELTILGSAINPFTHLRATALLGRLPLHAFETQMFDLDAAEAALAAVRAGTYDKVQIRVHR